MPRLTEKLREWRTRTRRLLRGLFACAALIGGSVGAPGVHAQNTEASEYDVKAAFLLNIARYVEWPAAALPSDAAIVIGILGNDPFGAGIDRLVQGRRVNERPITVRRSSRLNDLKGSHVLFISASERERAPQICSVAEAWHTVTVGDTAQTAPFAVINFDMERGRIVFSANLDAALRAGTRISSKLLRLAKSVRGAATPGAVTR